MIILKVCTILCPLCVENPVFFWIRILGFLWSAPEPVVAPCIYGCAMKLQYFLATLSTTWWMLLVSIRSPPSPLAKKTDRVHVARLRIWCSAQSLLFHSAVHKQNYRFLKHQSICAMQNILCNLINNLCKILLSPWSDQKFGILATEFKKTKNKKQKGLATGTKAFFIK